MARRCGASHRARRHWGRGPYLALAAGVLVACGGDEHATDTVAPDVVVTAGASTTSTPSPPTSFTTTTTPTATATNAPTSTSTTSSTSTSTSTSSTTSSTTTTTLPAAAELVLGADRLGTALFGTEPEAVIAYLTAILGQPVADSGWADPTAAFGVCPGTEVRGVAWGDLLVLFSDSSTVATDRRHLFSYSIGPPVGSAINPAGMATAEGIGVGSTVADLKAAYPGVYLYGGDDIFDPYFVVSETLTGFLTGATDTDTVQSVIGGIPCGE